MHLEGVTVREELTGYVAKQQAERAAIQKKITELNQQRTTYLVAESKRLASTGKKDESLDGRVHYYIENVRAFVAANKLVMPVAKEAISLRVDEDVLAWFRGLGPRYQTRMNAVLRSFMKQAAPRSTRGRARQRTGAA